MSYLDLTILDMHKALVEKKVTSLELVEEAIERLTNDKTNALEATNYEEALKEAALIEEVKDLTSSKDNFSTITTSPLFILLAIELEPIASE